MDFNTLAVVLILLVLVGIFMQLQRISMFLARIYVCSDVLTNIVIERMPPK